MTLTQRFLNFFSVLALFTAGSASASIMYVLNNGSENLYTIDVTTRTGTLIGNAGINVGFGGLGFDAAGTLYGYTTGSNSLYTVNTSTGAWNLVGPSGTSAGDSFDINPATGKAYVTSFAGLFELDLTTGATVDNVPGAPFFSAGAFSDDGTFFVNAGNTLGSLDLTTGAVTNIGPGLSSARSLAYNPNDGLLYTIPFSGTNLVSIDTTTGIATDLGAIAGLETGGQWTMATFAIAVEPPNGVPSPAPLGLIGLGLLWLRLRRKA